MSILTDPAASTQVTSIPATNEALEETLALSDGRTLAYSHHGPADSNTIVLWYHGFFSIGDASNSSRPIRQRNARYIAPTLPGWGDTSPLRSGTTFHETVVADTRALFQHLYPSYDPATSKLRVYVGGGSFGTCPAQVISGAPYNRFPHGRQIVAVVLAAPFTPFAEDAGYNSALSWRDWLAVGAPSRIVPFNLILRLARLAVRSKVRDVASAENMIRETYFDNMGDDEKARYEAWRERNDVPEGQFTRHMAEGMTKSVSKSWAGFFGGAKALHEDWGFRIKDLDEHHQRKLVVIVVGKEDTSMSKMSRYLVDNYKHTKLVQYEGGHISGAWSMDVIWEETFTEIETASEE